MSGFLTQLYQILQTVIPNKVTYGTNIVDAIDLDVFPFIVYQEISNRGTAYADNRPSVRIITYQITLVTKEKSPTIEGQLETALQASGFNYQMTTEYVNEDNSVNRVYEIKQEEIIYE
jgi:hypothetical protein